MLHALSEASVLQLQLFDSTHVGNEDSQPQCLKIITSRIDLVPLPQFNLLSEVSEPSSLKVN